MGPRQAASRRGALQALAERRLASSVILGVCLWLGACRAGSTRPPRTPREAPLGPVTAIPVSADDFAARAHELLREGRPTTERRNRLAGVVAAQLDRAAAHFAAGEAALGHRALTGAFLLVRAAEDHPELFAPRREILRIGADASAREGNAGRSLALYERLDDLLSPGIPRNEVRLHLDALARWREAAGSSSPILAAGSEQRLWSHRIVLDPAPESLQAARVATLTWIERALSVDPSALDLEDSSQRATALEAYRALQGGGAAMVALYLRHGDASGALDALDEGRVAEIAPPGLVERVQAASAGEPRAWAELHALFAAAAAASGADLPLAPEVAGAAAWGAAVELYRAAADSGEAALPLASLLPIYGMPEVMPLVLVDALGAEAGPREVAPALALVLESVATEGTEGRLATARSVFTGARPLLERAATLEQDRALRPSAARVHYTMAALESRAAEVDRARERLLDALRIVPEHYDALRLLAALERQRRDDRSALDALERAAATAAHLGATLAVAEARLQAFEIHRDLAAVPRGEAALRQALTVTLAARESPRSGLELAHAERLLARALEHYGATDAAARATWRAVEAARVDLDALAASLVDGMRRAVTFDLLPLGRQLGREALAANLEDDDLVYLALWLKLLESRNGAATDGTASEALERVTADEGWVSRLRDWGQGTLDTPGLLAVAGSTVERTEAQFYAAMAARAASNADAALAAVAGSPAIELVEVTIARDLLAASSGERPLLPANVVIP